MACFDLSRILLFGLVVEVVVEGMEEEEEEEVMVEGKKEVEKREEGEYRLITR